MARKGTLTVRIVGDTKPFEKAVGALGGIAGKAGKAIGASFVAGFAAVATAGTLAVKTAASFEQAFAGVRKTLDTSGLSAEETAAELDRIARGLRDMATEVPIAVEELTGIAELAGQLGVSRESILDFTRVIAEIGVASNLTTEEAATQFAKFANIMGTPQSDVRRLGDAVINLGNNLATTEADIVNFGLRIAGAGQIAGLTEEQVFAIGAAMSSVGVEAEAGGTSVQKVLIGITESVATGNSKLKTFAKTAGVSAKEFQTMWEKDAAGAFQLFVEGLGAAGTDAFAILKDLGLTDQRLTRAFLSIAGAGDLLGNALDLATDSSGALANEAALFFDTTTNQWQTFKNTVRDAFITIGNAVLPTIKELVSGAGEWVKANQPLIEQFGDSLARGIEKVVDFAKRLAPVFSGFFGIVRNYVTGDLQGLRDSFLKLPEWAQPAGQMLINLMGFFRQTGEWVKTLIDRIKEGTGQPKLLEDMSGLGQALFILTGPLGMIVRDLLPALAPLIGAVVPVLAELANDVAPVVAELFAELATAIIPVLVGVLEGLTEIIREHPEILWAVIGAMAAWKTVMMVQLAAQAIPKVIGALGALKTAFLANPWAIAAAAVVGLATLIIANWDTIKEAVGKAWEWIKTTAGTAWEAVKNIVGAVADWLKNLFLNWTVPGLIIKHWDNIKDAVTRVKDWIVARWNDIIAFFRKIPGKINDIARNMWDGIVSAFKGAVNGIIDAWNRLDISVGPYEIPGWVPFVGGNVFHIKDIFPDIPRLHSGGVFQSGSPSGEGLAFLRDGEVVVPPEAIGSGGSGDTINVFVLTWEDFTAKVREAGVDIGRLGWR